MVDINQYYQNESSYLKADDLEHGKKYPLTIKGVEVVEFTKDGVKSQKLALSFREAEKKLTVNKTNAMVIASVHGGESDNWPGKKIFVYRAKVQFGDKMVDAVRVDMPMVEASISARPPAPLAAQQRDNPPFDPDFDEVPF